MRKTADQLFHLAARALTGAGAHEKMAQAAARHLVRAEEQGLATHGMSRVPFYVAMLKNGRADGAARPRIVNQRPGACLIDNADGLPYESCELAIAEIIERAKVNGVGLASITNSNHVGRARHPSRGGDRGRHGGARVHQFPGGDSRLGRQAGAVRHQSGCSRICARRRAIHW